MQRAFLSAIVLALVLSLVGVHVILRRMSFFGDGLAHASLAGVAIGLLTGWQPLVSALVLAVALALLIYFLERKTTISSDALIGIFFTTSLALGVLLLNFKAGYQPELISFLFGNILTISWANLYLILPIAGIIILLFLILNKEMTFLTIDRDSAFLAGIPATLYESLLYVSLAISVVLGVRLVGIILVGALLVIPASIAKLTARSFLSFQWLTVIFAELIVVVGLALSYFLNWPSGATIIVFGGFLFLFIFLITLITAWKSK